MFVPPVVELPSIEEIEEAYHRVTDAQRTDMVAQLTGFSVDLLSGIEENRVQPQLGTLIKLSKALDSAFGRILSGAGGKPYAVTRKGQRMAISRSTSGWARPCPAAWS